MSHSSMASVAKMLFAVGNRSASGTGNDIATGTHDRLVCRGAPAGDRR